MDNLKVTGIVIGALVVGALTGATLGILFAPDKGSKTRSNIFNGAKDMTDDIKKRLTDEAAALRKKAEELEELAKEKMDDITNNVKHKAEEATKA
ncbi:MAG: YtxH domain-containing protein [Paludibacteraceae bacterium]|jgi:gas vesicle protein|nr:YtxH domain-containing protein [Paludibacteraceae bacterium]